jgi:hypothetical protein
MNDRPDGLLAWQWGLYPNGHQDRVNLLLHLVTAPLFSVGTLAALLAPVLGGWLAPAGLALMGAVLGIQGAGHAREANGPAPFRSRADALLRLCVENWFTFPRFVLSGRWAEQWRAG